MLELEVPLTARPSVRETATALRAAGKSRRGVSAWSIYVNRPAGRYVAAIALRAGISPNRLSLLSGLLSFAGILALALGPPRPATGAVAAAALVLGFVLDSADGQLARFTGRCTPAGEWLDHLVDCAVKLGLHGAVTVAWLRLDEDGRLIGGSSTLLLPMAFQCVAVLMFFGGTFVLKLAGSAPLSGNSGRNGVLRSMAMLPIDHGVLCLIFAVWFLQPVFLLVYAVFLVCHLLSLLLFSFVWFRRLRDG